MSIEQCQNFHREFTKVIPYREVSYCSVAGTDMRCNSYSDACPTPQFFIPRRLGSLPIFELAKEAIKSPQSPEETILTVIELGGAKSD